MVSATSIQRTHKAYLDDGHKVLQNTRGWLRSSIRNRSGEVWILAGGSSIPGRVLAVGLEILRTRVFERRGVSSSFRECIRDEVPAVSTDCTKRTAEVMRNYRDGGSSRE